MTSKILGKKTSQAQTYSIQGEGKKGDQPLLSVILMFRWHAKGIVSTFVSLSLTND